MAQTSWTDYLKLLDELSATLEQLTQVERTKTAATAQGDLAGVEACMKQEQVLSLSLRGFDQRRERMLAQLGMAGVSLSHLQERSPEEYLLETKRAAERLRQQYTLFQGASEVARNTLECNLRAIEQMQNQQAGDSAAAQELRTTHQTDFRA